MRRLLMFLAALLLAGLIVVWAAGLRQETAVAPPTADLDALVAHVAITPTPAGQLRTAQPVPFPTTAGTLVAHDAFFPLRAGHALDCTACHTSGDYRGTPADCIDCHAAAEPHNGQYGTDCALCHEPVTWNAIHFFDHSFSGGQDCAACHAPPPDHFPGACRICHQDTGNFRNATFDHRFPIHHEGANGDCAVCHPGGNMAIYTCTACHDQQEMIAEHGEEGIVDIANCVACHADGREPDED